MIKKSMELQKLHEPVLVKEVIKALRVKECAHLNDCWFIDATLGLGGHLIEIIKSGGKVLGIDADKKSLKIAKERVLKARLRFPTTARQACPPSLSRKAGRFKLIHGNFKDIDAIVHNNGLEKVSGILFDLGVSSYQLESKFAGFSFQYPSTPLDMRMDVDGQSVTASDLLNALNESQLVKLFSEVLSRGLSRRLAKEIVLERQRKPIEKVGDFLEIIRKAKIRSKKNPATLPFLALRIAVNSELENLTEALPKSLSLLKQSGRLVVISFHSGEDRIVKEFFKKQEDKGAGMNISRKPILPSEEEVKKNPKARSAKMRVFEVI